MTVLPATGTCATVPLSAAEADATRVTARRLAMITSRVAARTGAEVLKASDLSRSHDACSAEPWVNGFPLPGGPSFVPYHPNASGVKPNVRDWRFEILQKGPLLQRRLCPLSGDGKSRERRDLGDS